MTTISFHSVKNQTLNSLFALFVMATVILSLYGCAETEGKKKSSSGPSWKSIQADILSQKCTTCHSGGSPAAGLSWEAGKYKEIVTDGKMSQGNPEFKIIEPGDKSKSYAYMKITNNANIVGAQMPLGGQLAQGSIDIIGAWIDAGALEVAEGETAVESETESGEVEVDWAYLQENLLQKKCVQCHNEANATAGLSWADSEYATIVTNGKMNSENTFKIIDPKNSKDSYFYMKISGDSRISGSRMPATGEILDDETLKMVAKWIDDGALEKSTTNKTADDSSSSDSGTSTSGSDSSREATWEYVQANIFAKYCVICHSGEFPMGGMSLEADQYTNVVVNKRLSSTRIPIVNPGNSDGSYIYMKITGDANIKGVQMPAMGGPLSDNDIALIKQWIDVGAPGPMEPNWDFIQSAVFENYCVICHNSVFSYAGLSWEADQYDAIVTSGKLSSEVTSLKLVEPGSKEKSYLYLKITGNAQIKGSRMPGLGVVLDETFISLIGQWIDDGAGVGSSKGGSTSAPSASWDSIQADVLQTKCVTCHGGASPAAGLSWQKDQYDAIVTNGKKGSSGVLLIKPSDSANSYLYQKLTGEPTISGSRMPLGGPYLEQTTIDKIKSWIDAGAPKTATSTSSSSTSTSTSSGSTSTSTAKDTWTTIQSEILKVCTSCHGKTSPAAGLSWEADQYDTIVTNGKTSTTGDKIIAPGKSADSYMYKRITGKATPQMPLGGPYLDDAKLARVAAWIDAGAPK
ncbi:MAG: hypothetical protein HQM11_05435 [SAR324 cluster bacterium]|nr:hypothetical protein [SAR324 cluster bacterium]